MSEGCKVVTQDKMVGEQPNNDIFSLKLKSEYILKGRAASLPPLIVPQESSGSASGAGDRNRKVDEDTRSNRNKKGKGMNKKRPRDERITAGNKICMAILRGTNCQYGDKCRFSHDMKEYLHTRPEDIHEVEICPFFARTGNCPFGIMCRVGSCHINFATGQSIIQEKEQEDTSCTEVVNGISKDLQIKLRKKQYPFVCKRFFEKKNNPHDKNRKIIDENIIKINKDDVDNLSGKNNERNEKIEETKSSVAFDNGDSDNVEKINHESTVQDPTNFRRSIESKTTESKQDGDESNLSCASSTVVDMNPLPTRTRKIIDFSNKVYIAPLTTVGNLPFRRIMKKFGADITCGEMALAQGILEGKASEWALLKRHPEEDVFGVQIAAGFPDMFTRTMELIENETKVDFVDLNLGCPLDLVCDKGSGAALMLRDKNFHECLKGITSVLSCPITIKMRTGWDEKKPIAHNLVPKIQSWGLPSVAAIMIHGRSRLQRYSKEANWDFINQVATSQDRNVGPIIPVIGNGDILNYTDYEEKVLSRPDLCSCAMLARGALIKPWLPTEIKERRHWDISASERLDILKDFVRFGLENWGSDQQGVNNCRRFLLEWLSFLHRYVPVGILDQVQPQQMNQRPPVFMCGRSDLETLFLSNQSSDWIKISEMLLGPVPEGFKFEPKHKANAYVSQ